MVLQAVMGGDVGRVTATTLRPEVDGVEGLVTDEVGVGLAVIAADCVPVLLADEDAGVVAAAHAGRRGTAAQIVPKTVAAMVELGARTERVRVWFGPAICGACYEVGAEVQGEVAPLVPAAVCQTRDETPGLDLRAGLRAQLVELGVASIDEDSRCTAEDSGLYSFRRDGTTGRQGAAIALLAQ